MAEADEDTAAYADFLQMASSHNSKKVEHEPVQNDPSVEIAYLQSETDEPWRTFEVGGAQCETAEQFADLVKEAGESTFVESTSDEQYEAAGNYVAKKLVNISSSDTEATTAIQLVEIRRGTRVQVFCVIYDHIKQQYRGLRSLKIES